MAEVIDVAMGGLCIGVSPAVLTTSSIGSCVAVCLYSQNDRAGALAHVMLPERPIEAGPITELDYKYADVAFQIMVSELQKAGIPTSRLIVKMVGGANMFPGVQGRSHKIGEKNIEAVKGLITKHNLRLDAEETGGNSGRALSFDLANGIVAIKITI